LKSENTLKRLLLLLSFALFFSPVFAGDSERLVHQKGNRVFQMELFQKRRQKMRHFYPKVLHMTVMTISLFSLFE